MPNNNPINSPHCKQYSWAVVLLFSLTVATGCSSSENSTAIDSSIAGETEVPSADSTGNIPTSNPDDVDTSASESMTSGATTEQNSNDVVVENTPDETIAVPDPMVQNSTRIDFDITVPAYQSNSLQVQLTWDNKEINASWVGDELWTVSDDFSTNTEHLLSVTFSDGNGNVPLARYENILKTGTNASEYYFIAAEQFNYDQFDSDNDGVSNFTEALAGTNPLVNEVSLIDVRESYIVPSLNQVSLYYEDRIPASRPYFEYTEELPTTDFYTDRKTHVISINVDADGTGSFSDKYRWAGPANHDITTVNQIATRTITDNSIIWDGTFLRYNTGAGVGDDIAFTMETKVIDDTTRTQTGTIEREQSGSSPSIIQSLSYAFTGTVSTGTSVCEPTAGSAINNTRYNHANLPHTIATINKGVDDDYWAISIATPDGEIIETYFAERLSAQFYCEFGDL